MVFDHYARYYNLLYQDKNYEDEVNYLHTLIQKFAKNGSKIILDIGCGTGTHASFLVQKGYTVSGIDLSEKMIKEAVKKNISNADFFVRNIAESFDLARQFDVITCLFHVLSYQTKNKQVSQLINNAANHLTDDGIFIFDFWYTPAVLTERPSVRIKRFEDDDVKIIRLAEPVLKINGNVVDVNYELLIEEKLTHTLSTINEVHPMRYFSLPEIEQFLVSSGMELLYAREWMTDEIPSDKTWGVCCVAKKQ